MTAMNMGGQDQQADIFQCHIRVYLMQVAGIKFAILLHGCEKNILMF
jgi:hypothetical protein